MSVIFKNDKVTEHRASVDKIKAALQRGDNNTKGAATFKEAEPHTAYNACLAEGLTPEIIEKVSQNNQAFAKATHIAVAELAGDVFVADPNIDKVVASVGYFGGNSSLITSVDRSKEYPNIKAGEGEPTKITKHLVVSQDEDIRGHGLKSLKDSLSAEFKDSFLK